MLWAKISTAITITVGPILDSTGAEYTGAVIGDLTLRKHDGSSAAMASAATLTHVDNGHYTLVTTTGNMDTAGRAQIRCNKSTYQMPPVEIMVLPAAVYDTLITNGTLASNTSGRTLAVDSSGIGDANVVKLLGTAWLAPGTAGTPDVNAKLAGGTAWGSGAITAASIAADAITAAKIADGAIDAATFAAGAIDNAAIATDAIGAAELAASAVTEIQSGLATTAALVTAQADLDDIQTRLPAALVSGRIDASVGAYPGNTVQTGDAFARIGATGSGLTSVTSKTDNLPSDPADESLIIAATDAIVTAIAAVQADTDNLQTRIPAALVSGRIDASVGAMAANTLTASALATDAVTEIQSGLGAGLDAAGVRAAVGLANANLDTQLTTIDDFLDTEVAAIVTAVAAVQADTDNIQTRIPAALTANGNIKSSLLEIITTALTEGAAGRIAAAWNAFWNVTSPVATAQGVNQSGDCFPYPNRVVVRGTVGTGSTTTSIVPSALSPAGVHADQFKGAIVIFDNNTTTAALRGQRTDVTASSATALAVLTVTALTDAPASTDSFSVV